MKKISKLISLMALSLVAVTACNQKEYPEYVPAEKPDVAEVYFANNLPSSYDLKGKSSFAVKINRVNAGSALTVNVTSGSDPLFTIPSSVTFAADATVADLVITFEEGSLVAGTEYNFNLSVSDQTSIYGDTSYSFKASIPAAWVKWKKGHMTEVWWGEEEDEYMYVQDLGNNLFYCYVESCFDTEDGAEPTDYYFYWDKNTNYLSVPFQFMGWYNGDESLPVYFGDAEAWYKDYYGGDEFFVGKGYKSAADYAYNYQNENRPYYDGNGGFYLADYFTYPLNSSKPGYGFQFGGDQDVFIAEGFDRKTNYNEAYEYEALWVADVKSEAYDTEWEEQAVRIYSEKPVDKEDEDKVLYYLSDYFGEDYGLAFIAHSPETLAETGEAVFAVDNEQYTGQDLFGQKLYAEVKGGKVIWEEDADYPTFEIKLSMYTEGEDGKKVTSFGTFTETINPTGELQEWFDTDDLYGDYLEGYIGSYEMHAEDYFNAKPVKWNFTIEKGGKSTLLLKGFAPYNPTAMPNNVFKIPYDEDMGIIYLGTTVCEGPFIYSGVEHELTVYPASTKSGQYYSDSNTNLIGGWVPVTDEDYDLVFVNNPGNKEPVDGVFFSMSDMDQGGLSMFYNLEAIYLGPETSSVNTKKAAGWSVMKSSVNKMSNGLTQSARMTFGAKVAPQTQNVASKAVNKTFNHTPVESTKDMSEKLFEGIR